MGTYDHGFVSRLTSRHPETRFHHAVETGTCLGYSTRVLSKIYDKMDTVELSEDLYFKTTSQMNREGCLNINYHLGDSVAVLNLLVDRIQEPTVFYLDAHWSGDETVDWSSSEWKGYGHPTAHRGKGTMIRSEDQVPLLEEIGLIVEKFRYPAILYLDDMSTFDKDGRGMKDVGFVGNDWSHLHVSDIDRLVEKREVDRIRSGDGHQMAVLLKEVGS